jgi:hypothetical protein
MLILALAFVMLIVAGFVPASSLESVWLFAWGAALISVAVGLKARRRHANPVVAQRTTSPRLKLNPTLAESTHS